MPRYSPRSAARSVCRVLIDAWHSVGLGVPEKQAKVAVPTPETPPGTAFPPRRLTLHGTPIFELGMWCGTCPALFRKMTEPGADDLGLANRRLNRGLDRIDDEVLRVYGRVLPRSEYTILLLDAEPQLIEPGTPGDYFSHEQVGTWGLGPVAGSTPEDPGTSYYRTFDAPIDTDRHLHEFLVPMVPPTWNDPGRVAEYESNAEADCATAVAYSLLDVVQPATDHGEDHYEHWVLSHFLLDGHHKIEAAARARRPVRLLCFVDEHISLAAPEELTATARARTQPREARIHAEPGHAIDIPVEH